MGLEKNVVLKMGLFSAFALGTFLVPQKPAEAQAPLPKLLVVTAGNGEHGLSVVDPLTNKVVDHIAIDGLGGHPHEVAASPDGKFAYVTTTNFGKVEPLEAPKLIRTSFISVIDLAARKEVHRIELGLDSTPHGVVVAGGKVFFTAEGYQLVGRYDPASSQIDAMFGTCQIGTHMLAVSKDTKKIFTAALVSDSVVEIESLGNHVRAHEYPHESVNPWVATVIPVGPEPEGIAMSPDEKEVWTLNKGDGSISIINVAIQKVSETVSLNTSYPERLAFTPDGKRVIIIDGRSGDVLVLDAATRREIKRLPKVGTQLHGLAVAPDGSRVYVVARGDKENNVAIIDLKTIEVTGHISVGPRPEGIAWAGTDDSTISQLPNRQGPGSDFGGK